MLILLIFKALNKIYAQSINNYARFIFEPFLLCRGLARSHAPVVQRVVQHDLQHGQQLVLAGKYIDDRLKRMSGGVNLKIG